MNNRERLFRRLLPIFGLIFAGMVLAGVAALAGTLEDERSDEPLLPDLKALPPEDFRIESDGEAGIKLLRFSSTVWNAGRGPLELRGESDPDAEETRVTQNLYSEKGGVEEREVGEFVYHPDHDHWHFEDFALYELLSLTPEGELGSVVASSGKVTFCIMETTRIDGQLIREIPQEEYRSCGQELQGISPGWGDTYGASVRGQELNIEAVPDGRYALRSTADPENRILESDATNNAAVAYLEIEGTHVEAVQES